MSNLIHNYSSNARQGFIAAIRQEVLDDPNGPMASLARIIGTDYDVLGDVTMEELFPRDQIVEQPAKRGRRSTTPRSRKPAASATGEASNSEAKQPAENTEELKAKVFAAIEEASQTDGKHDVDPNGSAWVRAATIRELLDIDIKPIKLRSVLGSLIEDGKITITGKAAGTKYSVA